MENQKLMELIETIANEVFDGHFTVMKFTTNWRVSFGCQPQQREDISEMGCGRTLREALQSAIQRD